LLPNTALTNSLKSFSSLISNYICSSIMEPAHPSGTNLNSLAGNKFDIL